MLTGPSSEPGLGHPRRPQPQPTIGYEAERRYDFAELTRPDAECSLKVVCLGQGGPCSVRLRMFRALVFLLAGWPLLMPPGMCICQAVKGADITPRFSERSCADDHDGSCSDSDCDGVQTNRLPCRNPGVPTDDQHPPGCPANKRVDNSKLLQRYQSLGAAATAATPLPFFLDLSSGHRIDAPVLPSQPPDRPIYLALCTLLI